MDYKAALMALVLVSSTLAGCSGADDDDGIVGTSWYHAGEGSVLPVIYFNQDGTIGFKMYYWDSMTKKVCADSWGKPWGDIEEMAQSVYSERSSGQGNFEPEPEVDAGEFTEWADECMFAVDAIIEIVYEYSTASTNVTDLFEGSMMDVIYVEQRIPPCAPEGVWCNDTIFYEIRDDALIVMDIHGFMYGDQGECSVWFKVTSEEVPRTQEEVLTASDPSHIDSTVTLPEWCGDDQPEPEPEPEDVPGCMDAYANNYDDDATSDDGSCTYDER